MWTNIAFLFANAITDGGGIRGLSELIILGEIMERIEWKEHLAEDPIATVLIFTANFSASLPSSLYGP